MSTEQRPRQGEYADLSAFFSEPLSKRASRAPFAHVRVQKTHAGLARTLDA
jgi:hypothetical protein